MKRCTRHFDAMQTMTEGKPRSDRDAPPSDMSSALRAAIAMELLRRPQDPNHPTARLDVLAQHRFGMRARLLWSGPDGPETPGSALDLSVNDAPLGVDMLRGFARDLLHHSRLPR